jgi:hypothetical protein
MNECQSEIESNEYVHISFLYGNMVLNMTKTEILFIGNQISFCEKMKQCVITISNFDYFEIIYY